MQRRVVRPCGTALRCGLAPARASACHALCAACHAPDERPRATPTAVPSQLEVAVNTPERNALTARAYSTLASGRPAIVFCMGVTVSRRAAASTTHTAPALPCPGSPRPALGRPTHPRAALQHAHAMAEAFRAAGVSCEAVHGKLPPAEREDLLRRFKEGEVQVGGWQNRDSHRTWSVLSDWDAGGGQGAACCLLASHPAAPRALTASAQWRPRPPLQVLANCMILTEGYDETSVSCIVMARPTRSTPLYRQVGCRGIGCREIGCRGIGCRGVKSGAPAAPCAAPAATPLPCPALPLLASASAGGCGCTRASRTAW